jgi:hypothetical protein
MPVGCDLATGIEKGERNYRRDSRFTITAGPVVLH